MTSIGGNIAILFNPVLTSLSGLDNISAGSILGLTISGNPSLSVCEVKSVCDYLASPNGTVNIFNNASGCNSPEEVIEACETVGMSELQVTGYRLQVFPNPSCGISDIRFKISDVRFINLDVYDVRGKKIRILKNDELQPGEYTVQFDGSDLPAGIYLVRLQAGEHVETVKLVVMK